MISIFLKKYVHRKDQEENTSKMLTLLISGLWNDSWHLIFILLWIIHVFYNEHIIFINHWKRLFCWLSSIPKERVLLNLLKKKIKLRQCSTKICSSEIHREANYSSIDPLRLYVPDSSLWRLLCEREPRSTACSTHLRASAVKTKQADVSERAAIKKEWKKAQEAVVFLLGDHANLKTAHDKFNSDMKCLGGRGYYLFFSWLVFPKYPLEVLRIL